MTVKIYFIRHGQSYANLPENENYHPDAGLSELGQKQAQALAQWMPTHVDPIDAIYTSTMTRAVETADALADVYHVRVREDDRLREMGNNRWDHSPLPADQLPQRFNYQPKPLNPFAQIGEGIQDGELYSHFRLRVGLFVDELLNRYKRSRILVVCHSGVIEAAVMNAFNVGMWGRVDMRVDFTSVTYLNHIADHSKTPWRLHYLNRTEHLINLDN